jgi:hypothetical protein
MCVFVTPTRVKGTAFAQYERDHLGLRGLVPSAVKTLDAQVNRCLRHMEKEETNIRKNLYLQDLHDRNEMLYFKLLMAPLVYTRQQSEKSAPGSGGNSAAPGRLRLVLSLH